MAVLPMRWLIIPLLALLIALQYRLWVGEGSRADLVGLKRQIAAQETENTRLTKRNRKLQAEVEDLDQGTEALEARARAELGMIKPGETFIQVLVPPRVAPGERHQ